MFERFGQLLLLLSVITFTFVSAFAQRGADNMPAFSGGCRDLVLSKFEKETCEKLRITQQKKDYDEMLKRGEEVQRLSKRLVRSYELNGRLSGEDRSLLESLEKNVKKIRDELGGDGDGDKIDDVLGPEKKPNLENAVDKLRITVANLVDELKKTTRFSISATAIQSSNAVLTVTRFLRIVK